MIDHEVGKVVLLQRLRGLLQESYHGIGVLLAHFGLLLLFFVCGLLFRFVLGHFHPLACLVKIKPDWDVLFAFHFVLN